MTAQFLAWWWAEFKRGHREAQAELERVKADRRQAEAIRDELRLRGNNR